MTIEPTSWRSEIEVSSNDSRHLAWWEFSGDLAIFQGENYTILDEQVQTGLIYCRGIEPHTDLNRPYRYSAILILYNRGFQIVQGNLPSDQAQGDICKIDLYEEHSLKKIDNRAFKWAGVYIDYNRPRSNAEIEESLAATYDRIFN
jgi:hypothetical protein